MISQNSATSQAFYVVLSAFDDPCSRLLKNDISGLTQFARSTIETSGSKTCGGDFSRPFQA
jgi:hypothetical protein